MLRIFAIFAAFYLFVLAVASVVGTARGADCGPLPPEPETPAGCLYLVPICQCTADGAFCRIVWMCARLTPDLEPRWPGRRRMSADVTDFEGDEE